MISVVMPNYNGEKFIAQAIESILNQTYKDFEFIIIDDCSTDNSWNIIQEYARKDKRIRAYRNEKNLGVSGTLNYGLSHVTGEFIARMDSDDISSKLRFEKQVKKLEEGFDVVGSDIKIINSSSKIIGSRVYRDDISNVIVIESPLAHPSVMFRASLIKDLGVYSSSFKVSQDYDLWLRFYSYGAKFHIIHEPLLRYRVHDTQVKSTKTKEVIRTVLAIKKNAKKQYRMKFGVRGEIRMVLERVLLILPSSFVLWLFYLLRGLRRK